MEQSYFSQPNSEYHIAIAESKTMGAKLHQSKGKQPRSSSKVPKFLLSVKGGDLTYTTRRLA